MAVEAALIFQFQNLSNFSANYFFNRIIRFFDHIGPVFALLISETKEIEKRHNVA
jgi:hypothetical protein